MAIDYASEVGRVRLLISDLDEPNFIYTDDQISAFLAMNPGVKRAAAAALDALAANMLQVSGDIQTQDLQKTSSRPAAELRALAKALRAEADVQGGVFSGATLVS